MEYKETELTILTSKSSLPTRSSACPSPSASTTVIDETLSPVTVQNLHRQYGTVLYKYGWQTFRYDLRDEGAIQAKPETDTATMTQAGPSAPSGQDSGASTKFRQRFPISLGR